MNARELYSRVTRRLEANVPPDISPEYLRDFLRRHEATFTAALSQKLVALCGPDKLVDGYERILGTNTEPARNGHLSRFLVGLKARCHPGNPSIRQYALHWRYDGALRPQGGRWVRVTAKTTYADQPWKLWMETSWDNAAWSEEEAIRRFVEDHASAGLLWWIEGKTPAGPAADADPLKEERTQLTDPFAIQYARQWLDLAPQLEFDPDGLERIRDRRQQEATADWWRSQALPDPDGAPHVAPVQQRLDLAGSTRPRLERLPAWPFADARRFGADMDVPQGDGCPDCDDRGWYHDGPELLRCTYCGRYDSDAAMTEAHFELGCDQCGWPAGGEEDRSGSADSLRSTHPAVGRHARLHEDWYDGLMWKHTFPAGLAGTIVDVDARGRAEFTFDAPLPMSWRVADEDPGTLEGIFLPLELLDVEGGAE